MKNLLLISALFLCTICAIGQSKYNRFGVTLGGSIQHYNGNLGNSFFQFKTTCYNGITGTFGAYLNKSFDFNLGGYVGYFGYCQTETDEKRTVSYEQRCPGCIGRLGMGELRSMMVSGNIALKYKFANDIFLSENSKFAPYVYAGMGVNHLSDVMKRQCVNVGYHFTINGGAGIKYNITKRLNIGYNLGFGSFISKKTYYTNALASDSDDMDAEDIKIEKRKDMYMQNSLSIGVNF